MLPQSDRSQRAMLSLQGATTPSPASKAALGEASRKMSTNYRTISSCWERIRPISYWRKKRYIAETIIKHNIINGLNRRLPNQTVTEKVKRRSYLLYLLIVQTIILFQLISSLFLDPVFLRSICPLFLSSRGAQQSKRGRHGTSIVRGCGGGFSIYRKGTRWKAHHHIPPVDMPSWPSTPSMAPAQWRAISSIKN